MIEQTAEYRYDSAASTDAHAYLVPAVEKIVASLRPSRIIELGCGNGSVAYRLSKYAQVIGIDASQSGVNIANRNFSGLKIEQGSVYDDLRAKYGEFPLVLSLEVVEHLYDPRRFARTMYDLVEPGGTAIVSTPYHSYWKNLAIAVAGRMDSHFTALWDGGHIKFWSMQTLRLLLTEVGFRDVRFFRVGRIPALAKSMIAIAKRPTNR